MSKYLIFILIFNGFCFIQHSDTLPSSDHKTVGIFKRNLISPENKLQSSSVKNELIEAVGASPLNAAEPRDETKKSVNPPGDPNIKEVNNPPETGNNPENGNSKPETGSNKSETGKSESEVANNNPKKLEENSQQSNSTAHSDKKSAEEASKISSNSTSKENKTVIVSRGKSHIGEHPGAVQRGFYVFLGLSVIIIIYFIFKAFRLRPGAPAPTTVRKYGIVGRRNDMEMLPLPLTEEDDDDTLFDMGSQANR